MTKAIPNWQPISALPTLNQMISDMLSDVKSQTQNLKQAEKQPHLLDNHTVERILQVFGEQKAFLWVYEEQLMRWKRDPLATERAQGINHMEQQLEQLDTALTEILDIAEELKGKTIATVLDKSDLEIAMDILSGELKPPN